jgi:hypothetical protein
MQFKYIGSIKYVGNFYRQFKYISDFYTQFKYIGNLNI